MDIGRPAWRTPATAMLWEIWGQRRLNFACQAAILLASALCVRWMQHGMPDIAQAILQMLLPGIFACAFIDLLTCFGYIEIDARKVQIGFPGRLLLKPVSTTQLALVPMLFGGASLVTFLLVWNKWVLQALIPANLAPLWLSAVTLSFFWWMQAVAWSLPQLPGRSLIMLVVGATHLGVALMPLMPAGISAGWCWGILSAMLISAMLGAVNGLNLIRRGNWESSSGFSAFLSLLRPAPTGGKCKKFTSALQAQIWLEWQRQGILLPCVSCGVAFVTIPLIYFLQKQLGGHEQGAHFELVAAIISLASPLILSSVIGTTIARFDQLEPAGELPLYIAVRPMAAGGFVLAKLTMALASSALAWVGMLTTLAFWLALLGNRKLISNAAAAIPCGPVPFMVGCAAALLLLILFTWKNLVDGIGAGLTGRRWIIAVFTLLKMAFIVGLVALIVAAKLNVDFRSTLLHRLPALLFVCLAIKIAVFITASIWGLRRNVITSGTVAWIASGWAVCGLFVAGYAGIFCNTINKPGMWIWIALTVFIVLPLADLAIAPLALAWNRHR